MLEISLQIPQWKQMAAASSIAEKIILFCFLNTQEIIYCSLSMVIILKVKFGRHFQKTAPIP